MDYRIIDLDLDLDNPTLPAFFLKNNTNNLTLCAGDGKQEGITDIEWFTTNRIGYGRENKPTTIFMTTKNYMPHFLEENKQYLSSMPDLEVLLLVYDHESLKYRENLCLLFKDSIDNIYEDAFCYGKKLNLKILDCILKTNGIYHMERHTPTILQFIKELYIFENYKSKFTIDLDNNKIIKNNGNIIIVNENNDDDEYNEAIKTIENRKKLDEADREKRTKYRRTSRSGKRYRSPSRSRKRYRSPSRSQSRKSYRSPSRSRSRSQTKKKGKIQLK
jgi:hypothetical protein